MRFKLWFSLLLVLVLAACGGGGGGGGSTNGDSTVITPTPTNTVTVPAPTPGASGSIVYEDNGTIYVVNVATGTVTDFAALQYTQGGVSVSRDGTVAHLQEYFADPGGVIIRLTRLDGTLVREFNVFKDLSNINNEGGARISPDGKWVAFSINTNISAVGQSSSRADRVYVCNTVGTVLCTFWNNVRDPGWTADNRVLAVDGNRTQLYRSNANLSTTPTQNRIDPIGPDNLEQAFAPEGTPDNNGIVFSTGSVGIARTFGLNLASGVVTRLFTGSVYQRLPLAVGDSLLYQQGCCVSRNGGGAGTLGSNLHRAPLNISITQDSPTNYTNEPGNYLRSARGVLRTSERYGYTPAVR
jgi:WD40-like Beta Propeller Repeat